MRFLTRAEGRRNFSLSALAGLCSLVLILGNHASGPPEEHAPRSAGGADRMKLLAANANGTGFSIIDATWTTAHIHQKGILGGNDTGLVVTYLAPVGRNPGEQKDWIGIYEKGRLDKAHRKDWDWVCPNEHNRCTDYGSAVVPAGDDGILPAATYTVAYWADDATESSGTPVATMEYVVPW